MRRWRPNDLLTRRLRSKPVPGRKDEINRHIVLIRFILDRDAEEKKWCTVQHGRTALMVAAMQARGPRSHASRLGHNHNASCQAWELYGC